MDTANTKVVKLDATEPLPKLDNRYDYIISLPAVARTAPLKVLGGRNICIVGGYLSTSTGITSPNITILDGAFARTVHCEGLLIDGRNGGRSDAFHLQCPNTVVQFFKNRVEALNGSLSTTHADVIQNLGTKKLVVDRFTGSSHYNNIYMRRENDPVGNPVGPATFAHCNFFGYQINPNAAPHDPVHTLRGISLGTQPIPPSDPTSPVNGLLTGSVWLFEYYVDYESFGITPDQAVWPHASSRMEASCRAELNASKTQVDWPHWRAKYSPPKEETTPSTPGHIGSGDAQVYGVVKLTKPAAGDIVKSGAVGLSYPRAA
jgi:hypothetical protein